MAPRRRAVLLIACLQLVAACSLAPPNDPPVGGPFIELRPGVSIECRGVDEKTCRAVGVAAVDELPADSVVLAAQLAPAQFCLGATPCTGAPPSCGVHASVVFDLDPNVEVVINVIGTPDALEVTEWDGPGDLGEHPIRDDVGGFCTDGPGVP